MNTPRRIEPITPAVSEGNPWKDLGAEVTWLWRNHIRTMPDFDPRFEWSVVVMLDNEQRFIAYSVLPRGDRTVVHNSNSEIFGPALRIGATKIVLSHNHPGGTSTPSVADSLALKHVRIAGTFLGVEVLDEVVLSDSGVWTTVREVQQKTEIEDEPYILSRDERCEAVTQMFVPDITLQRLIFDAAHQARVPVDKFVLDFCRGGLKRHLDCDSSADPKLSLAANLLQVLGGDMGLAFDAAADAPASLNDWAWDTALAFLKKEVLSRKDFTTLSAERVAAASV
jgi:hypothetical protein